MDPAGAARTGRTGRPNSPELRAACGGNRYLSALLIDALSTGLLRPFILLYAVTIEHMSITLAGASLTAGMVFGLALLPWFGRWLDTGARRSPVVLTLLVRVLGLILLLALPGAVGFILAALLLGAGSQTWPPAHAAVVSSLSEGRMRDEALAATRAVRNAGTGAGALMATIAVTIGDEAMRLLALTTALGLLVAALIVMGVRVEAAQVALKQDNARDGSDRPKHADGDLSCRECAARPVF